ncbi:DUF3558 domain-containing protein [Amycolatopsis rhabdoformis]|uniref:DUF3558 domain-containing protein n=1 Tax=Amycolatopsis rhabdoformis TaxID=1448059 RepID=A0ABZ1I1T1_9PSEU|nr:DUF3558 domain-containing protein [Amycolatopsis rhabdoformis]WSE28104.1 DUF3558 domain-containing protein [Amycolatopsis rhabdoformis]
MRTASTSALSFGAVAVLALGVAACSSGDPGTALPVAPAASSASQAAKASQLPPRPADLPLTGVDPCELLGQAQLDELQVNAVPRKAADAQDGPTCVFDADKTEPFHAYHLRTVSADLQEWLTGARRKNSMTTAPFAVEGYPALTNYRAAGTPSDCEVLVGVAKGQTLAAQAFAVTAGAFTQQQLCDQATQAADLAVQYLKTRT